MKSAPNLLSILIQLYRIVQNSPETMGELVLRTVFV